VIVARNRSVTHQRDREEFPLRGLARCAACRHALTGAFSRGRSSSYPYYLCFCGGCSRRGKSLPAAEVHNEFTSFLDEIAPRPEIIHEIGKSVIKMAEQGEREVSVQRQRRRKQIGQLETEVIELIRMRAQGLITNEEFLLQRKRLADQRMAFESQARQTTDLAQVRADLQQILEPLSALRATWKSLEPSPRSRFDRLILPGGFVIGNIRTADRGLLFSTFRASAPTNSGVVAFGCVPSNRLISEIHEFREIICGAVGTTDELPIAV
jgi:hypothetical protein